MEEYRHIKAAVLSDIDDVTVIGITEEVIAQAVALLERFPLRSADALHIACASEWSIDLFICRRSSVSSRQSAASAGRSNKIIEGTAGVLSLRGRTTRS